MMVILVELVADVVQAPGTGTEFLGSVSKSILALGFLSPPTGAVRECRQNVVRP